MRRRSGTTADESYFPPQKRVRHTAFTDFEDTAAVPEQSKTQSEPNFQSRSLNTESSVHATPTERKGCKCKHSKCLKLYCECFASGTYCDECGCVNCKNNFKNETARQAAIELTLERKPNAFRRMAGHHTKHNTEDVEKSVLAEGCHCKRSRCLKKYCSCFQANLLCSDNCTCMDCENFEGSTERLALDIGKVKDASKLITVEQANLALHGAIGLSGHRPFQEPMERRDQNLQSVNTEDLSTLIERSGQNLKSLNKEDPQTCENAQVHQLDIIVEHYTYPCVFCWVTLEIDNNNTPLVYPPFGGQLLAPSTLRSSKLTYRSVLAGAIQSHEIRELLALLVVVSGANKNLEVKHQPTNMPTVGDNQLADSLVKQVVENSHGLSDQNADTKYNLQGELVDAINDCDPRSSDNAQQNGRPASPGMQELMCEEQDALFTCDATSHMNLDHGCDTDVYAEQEMLVLVNFREYLIRLVRRGNTKETQVSLSAEFTTEDQQESVVLDRGIDILS